MTPFDIATFTPLFFDTEFTHLGHDAELISIGMVDVTGLRELYLEARHDARKESPWVRENVVPLLNGNSYDREKILHFVDRYLDVTYQLHQKKIMMVSDCLAYDWVLFCDLFGGAERLPKFVFYIPLDLATLFAAKGIDPDIGRETFSGIDPEFASEKHNALRDARVIRKCFLELMKGRTGMNRANSEGMEDL